MNGDTKTLLGVLRAQAWQRAKGELRAVLESYVEDRERFDRMNALCEAFAKEIDDEGLAE